MSRSRQLSRRSLLLAAGAGAGAAATGLLTGCGGAPSEPSPSSADDLGTSAALWPTHVPFVGPAPDLPAGSDATSDVFLAYPSELVTSVDEVPGDGTEVSMMLETFVPPPTPLGANAWWQAINEALGVETSVNLTPAGEYGDKLAVVMAGGDLPDIIFIGAYATPPRFEEFVTTQCQDLTDFIAGDAILDYPNLANVPTYAWESLGRFDGRLFGIPTARSMISNALLLNRTLLNQVGAPPQWRQDEFTAGLEALSTTSRWGLVHTPFWHNAVHAAAFGAPNGWRVDGGEFVSMYTVPEFTASLEYARTLWESGVYHPDSLALAVPDKQTMFVNQSLIGHPEGLTAVTNLAANRVADSFELDLSVPYTVEGAEATWYTGAGAYARLLLKKAPPERIEMLLRVLNYLAAPIGTTEYELVKYGQEDVHFTRGDGGGPVRTEAGTAQNPVLASLSAAKPAFEGWAAPTVAERVYDWQEARADQALQDPTKSYGLRSATASRSASSLQAFIEDAINAVVTGREPMSHWDAAVAQWRADGGDDIAAEYAESYAQSDI